jgi:hypothetical protein
MTLPVYLSVDLDYFAGMEADQRWQALCAVTSQLSGAVRDVTLMRDHHPLSIRGWSPSTLRKKSACIVNLDEHDDAASGALGIGSWMTRYLQAGVRGVWVTPPNSDGVSCDNPHPDLLVRRTSDDCPVPDHIGDIKAAAFFVSPEYMVDRTQARAVVHELLFALERHTITANATPISAWTLGSIIELTC